MQDNQVHIDLETVDTEPTAQLLSIGAVFRDDEFYCEIDRSQYDPLVFTEDADTIEWWVKQGGFIPTMEAVSPEQAIRRLVVWMHKVTDGVEDFEVWANAPSFDCAMLTYHFKQFNITQPWEYYQEQDVRTIKRLATRLKLDCRMSKNPHHALTDAKNQRDFVDSVIMTLIAKMSHTKGVVPALQIQLPEDMPQLNLDGDLDDD